MLTVHSNIYKIPVCSKELYKLQASLRDSIWGLCDYESQCVKWWNEYENENEYEYEICMHFSSCFEYYIGKMKWNGEMKCGDSY